jgi:hypothetical protein
LLLPGAAAMLLTLPGFLMTSTLCLRRYGAISGSKLDLKSDNLVPYRVAALALWNREKLTQATAWILRRVSGALGIDGRGFGGLLAGFFVHGDIIL